MTKQEIDCEYIEGGELVQVVRNLEKNLVYRETHWRNWNGMSDDHVIAIAFEHDDNLGWRAKLIAYRYVV